MRIIYDVRPLQTPSDQRGIGTVTRAVLETLSREDYRHLELKLLRWPGDPPRLTLGDGFRWSWMEVPRPRPAKLGWFFDRIGLAARLRDGGEVAHFNSPFDLDLGWPPVGSIPPRRVVTLYDLIPIHHWRETLRGKHRLLVPIFMQMAANLRYAWRIISISQTTADDAVATLGLDPRIIRVAPLGVAAHFRPRPVPELDAFCERHAIERPYLLYVGGANPNKNLSRLVEAFRAAADLPRLLMRTHGFEPPPDRRVRLLPPLDQDDLARLYTAARLVVMPSLYEGFGLPVLEAMACGAPVVCSDIPPFREVAGDVARTFDPTSVEAMVAVLRGAWQDDPWLGAIGERGVAHAARFTWTRCARIVADTYAEAASG
jgi:alpha-1,3-rhamnosyl/mannosyltransferase